MGHKSTHWGTHLLSDGDPFHPTSWVKPYGMTDLGTPHRFKPLPHYLEVKKDGSPQAIHTPTIHPQNPLRSSPKCGERGLGSHGLDPMPRLPRDKWENHPAPISVPKDAAKTGPYSEFHEVVWPEPNLNGKHGTYQLWVSMNSGHKKQLLRAKTLPYEQSKLVALKLVSESTSDYHIN